MIEAASLMRYWRRARVTSPRRGSGLRTRLGRFVEGIPASPMMPFTVMHVRSLRRLSLLVLVHGGQHAKHSSWDEALGYGIALARGVSKISASQALFRASLCLTGHACRTVWVLAQVPAANSIQGFPTIHILSSSLHPHSERRRGALWESVDKAKTVVTTIVNKNIEAALLLLKNERRLAISESNTWLKAQSWIRRLRKASVSQQLGAERALTTLSGVSADYRNRALD